MKVSLCSKCRITPEITPTMLKCPKCGRSASGKDLAETVAKWNNEEFSEKGKAEKVVIKDEETLKAETIKEIKELESKEPEIEESKEEEKPIRKTVKKPVKKGAK